MFVITTIVDTIRIPAHMLAQPTVLALQKEIDIKYPNRVLMDVGLVICRYGDCLKITNGSCVPGDGGSHNECLFQLVIFRPFVEEVCVGKIIKSTAEGVQVSLGFFQDIFIPAYWMLRPSRYDERSGLWVWTPNYDEDNDEEADADADGEEDQTQSEEDDNDQSNQNNGNQPLVKQEEVVSREGVTVKSEDGPGMESENSANDTSAPADDGNSETAEDGNRFEMEIGSEIRFKVKSIQFTQVTNTAKGLQATTTTTAHSHSFPKEQEEKTSDKPLRKRSLSVDLSDSRNVPATMHIVASICEDGLGMTSWWTSEGDDEDDNEEEEEEIEQEEN